jgi:ribosomal protein S18 acetylase RimI-like enzyme
MITQLLREIKTALPPPNIGGIGMFRRWFEGPHIQVYIRVGQRVVYGRLARTLEVSNITIDEDARGQGHFSRLLDGFIELANARGETLFAENVISDIVRGAIIRRGFVDYQGDGANYIKFHTTEKGNQ